LHVKYDGLKLLVAPIGSDEFVKKFLANEVNEVMAILGKITEADTMRKINSGRRAEQGLYQIVRDCVNQLLRHLLRTIKPSLTVEAFNIIDDRTKDVICRLFDIN
jgi:hypothetical protein